MRNNYTCAVCQYSWLSSKIVKRCSNPACRSMKWNNQAITPMADFPVENKKNSAASPTIEINPFTALVEKRLHPERTDEQRKQEIDSLKSLLDISNKKGNESVLPVYPPKVDEYGPVLNYD